MSTSGKFRWVVHLLCGWCLLATYGDVSPISHATHRSHTIELAAAIAPNTADFSDTAQQQNCQCLVNADQQVKAIARSVDLQAASRSTAKYGQSTTSRAQLPDAVSLFALGIALRI